MTRRFLQICPHDLAPFRGLCERYIDAGSVLDGEMRTVFIAPTVGQPLAGATYLNVADLGDTAAIAELLNAEVPGPWDLIICHRYRAYWATVKSHLKARRIVALAHDYGMLSRWQRRWNRQLFARHVEFAGVAEDLARELAATTGHAAVLPNALDVDRQTLLGRNDARARLGAQADGLVIGYVGRLHYKKRPNLALQAFQLFAERHPDAQLVLLGDGEERERLAAQGGDNVRIVGFVEDAAALYTAFDALLHTARREAFGMVVLEAMYAGVPVVTQRQFGPAYVLDDLGVYAAGDNAVVYAEALERALALDRQDLTLRGQARVREMFSPVALARALEQYL